MPAVFTPSENIALLQESATIAVSQRAKALKAQGRPIIDLSVGEPDFPTPEFIREAAAAAMAAGHTRYTAVDGVLPLREAIAMHANRAYRGLDPVLPTEVVVSGGSKQSIYNACTVLFGAGDEVLIPTPSWTSYYEIVQLARATPVAVYGDPSRSLKVTADELAAAATPRTRGVMLNSPCNPTGAVYSAEELRAIVALAESRDWWVLSDEIYQRIAYEAPAPSVLDVVDRRDRLVVINGVAKAYAMTGWRIGWTVAPRAVTQAMTAFQSQVTSNANTIAQYGTLAALTQEAEAEAAIATMVAQFRRRRDGALAILGASSDIRLVHPAGAFYLYLDVSAFAARAGDAEPGFAFAQHLLEHDNVAAVPGGAFHTPAWLRCSYAAPESDVLEAMRRIVKAIDGR
ncbi:MAG: pyridoxal phosphate-dependent aminotransferase [Gemmatimonadaceae bacterium]|jgi:aspartate aminotransferase|nr:pyridoxal phosphate-dependent aminotransferase [Gemmatimonadaceae bacterium]